MSLFSVLLDLFLPLKCPFCQRFIHADQLLCEECEENLAYTSEQSKEWQVKESLTCLAPLWYREGTVEAVHRYKFKGSRHYYKCFGMLMLEVLTQEMADEFDVISWVPLGKKRFAQRGYNQAELLADVVAEEFDMIPVDLLVKYKENPEQSEIEDDEARAKNVEDVYRLLDEDIDIENFKILLVDDVITTGSTLESCIKVLKEAGASEVISLGLARSRK